VAEAMKLNTATSDGYQHHGNMANYLNQVAEALGPEAMDEGRYKAFEAAE
jgi:hypothetical protein